MVVDSCVLLAVMFDEPGAPWALERLEENAGGLLMSTVSLTEVLIKLRRLSPSRYELARGLLASKSISYVAPDVAQAEIAAEAGLRYPLNLGDCFVYALAVVEGCAILTMDRDFRVVDRPTVIPDTA